ncbi:hypothetical protein HJC23_009289 [Cyclotella cryptica]|uniref:WRKY19-like zinc finger domain-containing protein n=1 Tax=Cyclotella cryptica TaxID=29204 RepID=A0ABD3QYS6_9STRA|eukprot:CCRYP_002256-RA/>CCRYP_002256-RA protein AED:0.32 eAED:-0.72 QI:0/-1/0/1/-1/1/1/0/255
MSKNNEIPLQITGVTYEDIMSHMNAVDRLTRSRFGVTHSKLLQIKEDLEREIVDAQTAFVNASSVSSSYVDSAETQSNSDSPRDRRRIHGSTTDRNSDAVECRTTALEKFENKVANSSCEPRVQNSQEGGNNDSNLMCLSVGTYCENQKRGPRACAVSGCPNRRVQGGVCIAHGANRKLCKFPGCSKKRKVAGKCSAHGPQRKRCDEEGCAKAAVRGGLCIGHGGKKKQCSVEDCAKHSTTGGMCKRHYDEFCGI